jgi:O-antigen ligase
MTVLRIGLCLMLAFCVLALGTVEVWSISIMEISAAVLFLWWAAVTYRSSDAKIYWNPLNAPVLGLLAVGVFQLLLHGTSYPYLTRVMLLKVTVYFLVLFLLAQAFRARKDLQQLAWFVMSLSFAVSLLGIAQYFTAGSEIYWMSDLMVKAQPFGPYVNRNHFAGFVELTLPTGIALMAFRGVKRDLIPLATLLTIVPVSAILLSASRAGIIGFIAELAILMLLARSRKAWQGKRAAGIAVLALAAFAIVAWVGAGKALERFSGTSVHDVSIGRRITLFRGAARIFRDYPIKGCGLGTLVDVFPAYEPAYDGKLIDHVHDDYIEGLAETGLLGGACGALFLWTLYREGRKNFTADQGHFSRGLHAGAIMAISGLLLHSFADFNLQIPANALLFLLQAYLVTAPPLAAEAVRPRIHRRSQRHGAAEPGAEIQPEKQGESAEKPTSMPRNLTVDRAGLLSHSSGGVIFWR